MRLKVSKSQSPVAGIEGHQVREDGGLGHVREKEQCELPGTTCCIGFWLACAVWAASVVKAASPGLLTPWRDLG